MTYVCGSPAPTLKTYLGPSTSYHRSGPCAKPNPCNGLLRNRQRLVPPPHYSPLNVLFSSMKGDRAEPGLLWRSISLSWFESARMGRLVCRDRGRRNRLTCLPRLTRADRPTAVAGRHVWCRFRSPLAARFPLGEPLRSSPFSRLRAPETPKY